jgi:hypothetical protein
VLVLGIVHSADSDMIAFDSGEILKLVCLEQLSQT